MRLHQLTLSAFGSFGDTETVDFDVLSDAGLFLLHGPTGAGKTTILDAVSFALFGRLAGVRSAGEGLRSHHGTGSAPTEVRLEVTIRGRRFRVWRQPRQVLAKQRGSGTREHAAKATVTELVGEDWVSRAAKPTDADAFLKEALHMGADQFHQIVMLPQGDFARFLRASPEERRGVLERLFATQRFADVEQWLRHTAGAAAAAVADVTEAARRALVAAATISGTDRFSDDASLTGASAWLGTLSQTAADRVAATTSFERAARRSHQAAKVAAAAATELEAGQRRYATAASDRTTLLESEPVATEARNRLDEARRAVPIAPLIAALTDAETNERHAESARALAREQLELVIPDLPAGVTDGPDPRAGASFLDGIVALLSTINSLAGEEAELGRLESERDALLTTIKGGTTRLETLAGERTARDARGARDREAFEAARAARQRTTELDRRVETGRQRLVAARERDTIAAAVAEAGEQRLATRDAEQLAYDRFLALFEAQLGTRAAAMAAMLTSGEPCPVCGGCEHPALATAGEDLVGDDEVEAARHHREQTKTTADAAIERLAELDRRLGSARATAGDTPAAELATDLEDAEREAAEQHELAASAGPLESQLTASAEANRDGESERDRLAKSLGAAREQRAALDAGISATQQRLTGARGDHETLTSRRTVVESQRAALTAFLEAIAEVDETKRVVGSTKARATGTAAEHGFSDLSAVQSRMIDEETSEHLAGIVGEHDRRLAAADVELARPELVAAAAEPAVDLAPLTEAVNATEQAAQTATTEATQARTTRDRLGECTADASTRLAELGPLVSDCDHKTALADLANGDDVGVEPRMRLSNYVLAARLEQVAVAASERLARMSSERYTIVHTDDEGDGRRKGGLGLRVVDAWTGTERPTESLSGGESFYASLALALGVADVVAAEAGGIQMETMFIDEGFGSLDDATLHDVMDVLDGLRAGGRAVGIVSHVADLRSRIAAQLEVVPGGPEGSTIRAA